LFSDRGALLALGEQIDGQEPRAQRQLGAVEDGAHGERSLVVALVALIDTALLDLTAGGVPAVRADIATWPAQLIQRLTALFLVDDACRSPALRPDRSQSPAEPKSPAFLLIGPLRGD